MPLFVFRLLLVQTIRKIAEKFHFSSERVKVTFRIFNLLFAIITVVILAGIWGVERKDLLFFITSTVSVLGIAFFAQWSILSNITSGLVMFFSHPLKVGDKLKIMEKDYEVEGTLMDVSIFFMHIKTNDGFLVTVPNSVALQKTILIVSSEEDE